MAGEITSPIVFFFDADAEGVSAYYGGVFDPVVLFALAKVDTPASTSSRILRGDALASTLCLRVTSVSQSDKGQSHTLRHDKELFKTIIWDLADAFSAQWHTVDLETFPLDLARKNIHCIVLPTLPTHLRGDLDLELRGTTGYLGSVELDLGNPIQSVIFIEYLISDAFVQNGAVYLKRYFDADAVFEGAADFKPRGLVYLEENDFEEQWPELPKIAISDRGRESLQRYQGKQTHTIEDRVIDALADLRNSDKKPFSFSTRSAQDALLEAELPEAKFVRYLLNPDHKEGAGKAKFFREVLAIEAENWRYLAAQFHEGLKRANLADLKVKNWEDGFGASFNCVLPITGLNGRVAFVLTNWIMRPGELPQLSTAIPGEGGNESATVEPAQLCAVSSSLKGTARWEEVYRIAHAAGMSAAEDCVPTPMKLVGYSVEMDGMCGFAWVTIPDARKGFARWVVKSGAGSRGFKGGASIIAAHSSQSVDRAEAYAKAFASVLKLNGIECTVESRLD